MPDFLPHLTKTEKILAAGLGGVFILIIIGTLVYMASRTPGENTSTQDTSGTPQELLQASPGASLPSASNISTYEDEDFSVEYPPGAVMTESQVVGGGKNIVFSNMDLDSPQPSQYNISIYKVPHTSQTAADLRRMLEFLNFATSEARLDTMTVRQYTSSSPTLRQRSLVFDHNSSAYEVKLVYFSSEVVPEVEQIFSSFLSSFKLKSP